MQAGGYGEHRFDSVEVNGKTQTIAGPLLNVRLEPGAGARLRFHMARYVNPPTLAQPWDRGWFGAEADDNDNENCCRLLSSWLAGFMPNRAHDHARKKFGLNDISLRRCATASSCTAICIVRRVRASSPVLIVRTPYGVQRDGVHQALIKFAQHGYAVYVQDVRGRYESEGKWDPFRNEANDGYDTIEWAAKQPWSNGQVGLEGGSYLGHVQWRAATQSPPSLVTMFPAGRFDEHLQKLADAGRRIPAVLQLRMGRGSHAESDHASAVLAYREATAPPELKYETILRHLPLSDIDVQSGGSGRSAFSGLDEASVV